MTAQQVVWHIEGKRDAALDSQIEEWKRTRRVYFAIARTMGGWKGTEEELWPIKGDTKPVTLEKRMAWKQRLIELGKWRKKANS